MSIRPRPRPTATRNQQRLDDARLRRHPPGRAHHTTQKIKKNSPGEQGCQPADSRTIQFMVKEHSAGELDQCRLDQKGYWRMGKGKIAIGDVAERYSV